MFPRMGHLLPLWATSASIYTTLIVKNVFLIASLNLSSFSLKPLLLALSYPIINVFLFVNICKRMVNVMLLGGSTPAVLAQMPSRRTL